MNTTLADVLRGCEPGRLQSVGVMQVLPLLSDHPDDRFAPLRSLDVRAAEYGTLVFHNPVTETVIMPRDAGFLTGTKSQDHALPVVGIVQGNEERTFDNAACIQQTTGGYIGGEYELIILPFPLRETALATRSQREYGKLWDAVAAFNVAMGLRSSGHVDAFLNGFKQQLDEFVAQFEPVPKQVGAVFLVNGKVAGIERVPSYEYWLEIWEPLVRVCYGSLALHTMRHVENVPDTRVPMDLDFDDLEGLEEALNQADKKEVEAAKAVIRGLIQEPLEETPEGQVAGLTISTLTSSQFAGQVVRDGAKVIYASMLATQERLKQETEAVKPFAL